MGFEQGIPHSRATLSPAYDHQHLLIGVNSTILTRLQPFDIRSSLDDRSCTFMTESDIMPDDRVAYAASLPEMHIATTDACGADVDQAIVWARLWEVCVNDIELVARIRLDGYVLRLASKDLRDCRHNCNEPADDKLCLSSTSCWGAYMPLRSRGPELTWKLPALCFETPPSILHFSHTCIMLHISRQ